MLQLATRPLAQSTTSFQTDVCVIGAGVVGLAIARSLALAGREILIVDKASTIGSETSSRNSEVIHAGLYYPPNSLKARFCVQGKEQLYQYCRERSIPFQNCGKLIVACHPNQVGQELEKLRQQGIANGVDDVRIISAEDVRAMEPQVESYGALWSPSTGVLDSHSFMTSLLADAEDHGSTLVLNTAVHNATIDDNHRLQLQFEDGTWLTCKVVVNAAGLWAPGIAKLFHPSTGNSKSDAWQPPRPYFARGNYFRLQGSVPFRRLIYPVPEPGGLGVHATIDWAGQTVKFGPDVEWVDAIVEDPSQISLSPPDAKRGERFYDLIRTYWPHLADDKLVPDYVGIRPKLNHPSNGQIGFEDFRIVGPETHGIRGLIHLFGIESPGLTSSMAIGDYVATVLDNDK